MWKFAWLMGKFYIILFYIIDVTYAEKLHIFYSNY